MENLVISPDKIYIIALVGYIVSMIYAVNIVIFWIEKRKYEIGLRKALGYKNKDTATGETETLLGFKVGAKATPGGSFAIWAESETAFEMEYMNINATTVKIDAAALLGLDLSITIPTPYFKWPW